MCEELFVEGGVRMVFVYFGGVWYCGYFVLFGNVLFKMLVIFCVCNFLMFIVGIVKIL